MLTCTLPSSRALSLLCGLAFSVSACDHEDRDLFEEPIEEAELREDAHDDAPAQPPIDASPTDLTDRGQYVGFDEETQAWLWDADGDSWPDVSEQHGGTDLLDPSNHPGPDPDASFPHPSCRTGFIQAGPRLCISQFTQNSAQYWNAVSGCRNQLSRICTYDDLTHLYLNTNLDASYNPLPTSWIGDAVADDSVLCGNASITFNNDPDIYNFDAACLRNESHPYWCCHDDEAN